MDFLDPKKRRAHRIRLFIGYGLVAIALAFGSLILLFAVNGYGVDRKTGEIIQNGIVFVDSHPISTTVYVNGQNKGNTNARYVLEEGSYNLELRQNGYRTWKRTFQLDGGAVERYVYPFLFPTKLVSADSQLYATTPDVASESPDRHWIVMHHASALNTFDILDTTTADNAVTSITVPDSVLQAHPNTVLQLVEWSTDNRHFLLKQTFDGGTDYIMVDRQSPTDSYSVTQTFGKTFSQIALQDKRFDRLYVYEGTTLEVADIKTKSINPVATHVLAFWPYSNDTILYVTDQDQPTGKVMSRIIQNGKIHNVRALPTSPTYLLNIAQFNGHLYTAVGTTAESRVYLYQDPLSSQNVTPAKLPTAKALLKVNAAQYVSFSTNARFIAVQGGSQFAIYDAENNRQYKYDQQLQLVPSQKAEWMDGHRLMLISNNKLVVFDFDGTNRQELVATNNAFTPFFKQDYTALFTVSPSVTVPNRTALVRTELIVKK